MVFQTLRSYLGRFALGFALGFPIAVTIVENIANLKGVHGISMQPTLNPKPHFNSDVVLVNCWAVRGFEGINRGDVVTLVDPSDPDAVLIKRVLGVEGDYVKSLNYKKKIVYIPKGHCWVEGDNHSHSHDSNSFGPPTLNPKPHFNSDVVLVNCWAVRGFEGINRGDVVTLVDPSDPDAVLIKRVLGVEGDYVKSLNYKKKIVYIPKGHCWVEGDNHSHSHDSNSFGPVSLGLIQGKATHVVWPPERWQRLENVIPEDWLVYGDDSSLELRSVKDSPVFLEAGTKRDGLSYHNQRKSYTYADESSSVSELISGPIS